MTTVSLRNDMRLVWNRFCDESGSAWFRHMTQFLDYTVNCRFDEKGRDLSFLIMQNNEPVAIAPLILQRICEEPEFYEFAFAGTNTPFPAFKEGLSYETKRALTKEIFAEIDRLASEHGVAYSRFFVDPLVDDVLNASQRINPITKYGYHETSLSTNIINLDLPCEDIFAQMRKGHKADIRAAIKNKCEVSIYSAKNITEDIFSIYKDLHFRDAGRKTRPDVTWDMMYQFIKEGKYILALLEKDKRCVTGALVTVYKNKAAYASGATNPANAEERGAGHFLQWKIIEYLKNSGARYYETGWNFYPNISQNVVSDKDISISKFKSGFGGDMYPVFRGEKFYSKEYFAGLYRHRADEYSKMIGQKW
ncbi:MAG TPA: GNAT family N-acetyltransferase [Candidatus Omnitrophota bacterium]|nr:GNAT family N-acetyltransferase [Candidatus Omnitrophota bacterium]